MFKNIFERYALQINDLLAPGEPANKVVIVTKDGFYNESGIESPEEYVNTIAIPWAFVNGVQCVGMTHGNFAVNRSYLSPEDVVYKKEDDYFLNVDMLNYVMAVMAAICQKKDPDMPDRVTLIGYWGDPDMCTCRVFKDEEEFNEVIREELAYFEERIE